MKRRIILFLIIILFVPGVSSESTHTLKLIGSFSVRNSSGYNDLGKIEVVNGWVIDHSIVSGDHAIKIYNFSDPLKPDFVSAITLDIIPSSDRFEYHNYIGDGENVTYIISINSTDNWTNYLNVISDMTSPKLISQIKLGSISGDKLFYHNQSLYIISDGDKYQDVPSNITRIDVSDPLNPEIILTSSVPNNYGHEINIIGMRNNKLIVQYTGTDGYYISILDPSSLMTEYSYRGTGLFYDGILLGDYYISRNCHVFNISNIYSISRVSIACPLSDQYALHSGYIGDNLVYLSNETSVIVIDKNLEVVSVVQGLNIDRDYSESMKAIYSEAIDGYYFFVGTAYSTYVLEYSTRVIEITDTSDTTDESTDETSTNEKTSYSREKSSESQSDTIDDTSDALPIEDTEENGLYFIMYPAIFLSVLVYVKRRNK